MTEIVKLVDHTHRAESQDVQTMLEAQLAKIHSGEIDTAKFGRKALIVYLDDSGAERDVVWAKAGLSAGQASDLCFQAALRFAAMAMGVLK